MPKYSADNLLARLHGEQQVQSLGRIAKQIQTSFDNPTIFSPGAETELEDWYEEFKPQALDWFSGFCDYAFSLESSRSPGHDIGHIVDNLDSILRMAKEYRQIKHPLKGREVFELAVAGVIHDSGRYSEQALARVSPDKANVYLAPAFLLRDFGKRHGCLPDVLASRILYAIASGSTAKTGHLTADVLHQADREQLVGPATIARGLAYDVVIGNRDLRIPDVSSFSKRLPIPGKPDDNYWLVQYEFYMRNLFPPVSPEGEVFYNRIKRQNAVILMLMLRGAGEQRYHQVFGPELGLVRQGEEGIHWSKKPIPAKVFQEAQVETQRFESDHPLIIDKAEDILIAMEALAAADSTVLPPNFDRIMRERIKACSPQERENLSLIILYSAIKRHEERMQDIKLLQTQPSEGIEKQVAQIVLKDLQKRETKFGEISE